MNGTEDWKKTRNQLIAEIKKLGFPESLGAEVAVNLGSPKAMERMIAYLHYVKPRSAELIVDEMLAICSDIDRWKRRRPVKPPMLHIMRCWIPVSD
jgi:hypothetical protein